MCKDIYTKISELNDKSYLEYLLTYNLATVIAKVKPASTLTLKNDEQKTLVLWNKFGGEVVKKLGLEYFILRNREEIITIMVYDKSTLWQYVNDDKNKKFLNNIDYSNLTNLDEYLSVLLKRFNKYNCPHELGLFLGIPLDDVMDFMECSDKKCLGCGYWKVFNNYSEALRIFESYDKLKYQTALNIINGERVNVIVDMIRNTSLSLEN